jgi:MSHA pilin protein MshC
VRSTRRRDGFTLVELVAVIGVLAILGVVAAPRFFEGGAETRRDLFRSELLAGLRYAQKLAVATGCPTQVSIAASSYAITQLAGCAGSSYTLAVVDPSTGDAGYVRPAPAGVALASTTSPIRFDALGRALDAGGAVTNATLSVGTRTITLIGETGLATAS